MPCSLIQGCIWLARYLWDNCINNKQMDKRYTNTHAHRDSAEGYNIHFHTSCWISTSMIGHHLVSNKWYSVILITVVTTSTNITLTNSCGSFAKCSEKLSVSWPMFVLTWCPLQVQGTVSIWRCCLTGISIMLIRRSNDSFIFRLGTLCWNGGLYIEAGPSLIELYP